MTICMPLMNSTISAGLLQTAISLITKSVSMCLYRTLQRSIQLWKYRRTDHHKCSQPALYPYHLERWRESTNRQATPGSHNVCQRIRRTTKDFTLIIDDSAVYHTLNDFRSAEARKLYQQRIQKQKDYDNLKKIWMTSANNMPKGTVHERRIWHPPFWNWKTYWTTSERNGPTGYQCPQRRNKEVETLIQRYLWKYLLSYRSSWQDYFSLL